MRRLSDCAILIPTRNRPGILAETLGRLRAGPLSEGRLMVYDDASDDAGAVAGVVSGFPGAEVIRGVKRIGQAGGRNVLLRRCGRERAVMLDDDQYIVEAGPLKDYVRDDATDSAAVVAFQSVNVGDGRVSIVSPAASGCASTFMGGACLFRVADVLGVGGFRESFTYGWEEPELAMRLWMAGHRVLYDRRIVAEHNHVIAGAARRDLGEYTFFHARNMVLTYTLNAPLWCALPWGAMKSLRFAGLQGAHRADALRGLRAGIAGSFCSAERRPQPAGRFAAWLRYTRECRQRTK